MKKINFIIIFITIVAFSEFAKSQFSDWSTSVRITNSKTMDHHPSMPERKNNEGEKNGPLYFVFDGEDSIGTNICI